MMIGLRKGPPGPKPHRPLAVVALTLTLVGGGSGAPPARAQGPQQSEAARANRLLADAIELAVRGDTAAALDRLENATKLAPNLAEAHYRRGMLLARQSGSGLGDMFQRRAADAELERAIRIDRGNPTYYLELGRLRLKQGVGRLEAQRLFNRALERARERGDPALVAETEAELGDIYFRRYMALSHRRMLNGSAWQFDPDEAMANDHYAKDFLALQSTEVQDAGELDLRQAEEHYRNGAAAWPASDPANAGLLGILYDGDRREEYLEQVRAFASAAPDNPRAQLFLGLGLWRMGRGREATRAFDSALAGLTPAEREQLTDLSVILRRSDAQNYEAMTSAQRAEFNRVYWSASDPLKLTPENEHMLEHLARVAYADLRFASPELHLRGWDTDRGVIYIRYGPPPVIANFAPETSQVGTDPNSVGKITTVWYYPERNLRFVFYGPPGYNFARFAGEFQSYAEDARYAIPVKYDNVPVNEAMDSVAVQVAEFRGAAPDKPTDLLFFADVPIGRMAAGVDLAEGPVEHGLFVSDRLEREVVAQRREETVQFHAQSQLEQRTYHAALEPGEYRYRVEARQPTTRRAARGTDGLVVEGFERAGLMLSDIVLADRVSPKVDAPRGHADFLIDPNPAMRYTPGSEVNLLWEIYNLTPDSTGTVRYRADVTFRVQSLERRNFAAKIVGGLMDAVGTTAKGDDQVALSYDVADALGDRDRLPGWVSVDLADAPNGTYVLELVITDLVSGQSAIRRRTFAVSDVQQ